MWPVTSEIILQLLAVVCTGISVKLIDDYLDEDSDTILGKFNFANYLGKGTPVYGLLSLAVAASLAATVSSALFFACYIMGMGHDRHSHYPLGLNGIQESLVVLIISCCLLGPHLMLFAMLFIFAVQLIDDLIDGLADQQVGIKNYACSWGSSECLLLTLICLGLAFVVNPLIFVPVLMGFTLLYALIITIEGGKSR
jgi:4-hydroxybenzoate polyprenyltransferase